jgi:serine protease Do
VFCAAIASVASGGQGRYLAVFADGRRISGDDLSGWGQSPPVPRLDGANLADPKRPLKWFMDKNAGLWKASACSTGYIEFIGGDRLVGQVASAETARSSGVDPNAVFLGVVPSYDREMPAPMVRRVVRVSQKFVRRIVWGRQPHRAFSPSTIFLQDGGRVKYGSIRWFSDGVTLLLENGVRRFRFSEIAELHLAGADSWQSYLRELAILNPGADRALFRVETSVGLVLTGSAGRFKVVAVRDRKLRKKGTPESLPECWYHLVQPAWSADAIWVPFDTISMRRRFRIDRLPLLRLTPGRTVQKSLTGFAWRWRRDRNVQGDRMMVAGRTVAGGLGVHANNELIYTLPDAARAFRTRIALDASSGSGGCVRGAIHLDSTSSKPLYRSDVIVGSGKILDSGALKLPAPGSRPRRLVLLADAAHKDRPKGADPLDIRDSLNWIDPVIELDADRLARAVGGAMSTFVPAWKDWTVSVSGKNEMPFYSQWDESVPSRARFVHALGSGGRRLTLSARRKIGPKQRWLRIRVRQVGAPVNTGRLEVRIDNRLAAYLPVCRKGYDSPYLVSLDAYQGKEVDLRIVYRPGLAEELIEWPVLALSGRKTSVDWRPLRTVSALSQRGEKLTVLKDGSILVSAGELESPPILDTYCIRAETDLPLITAIRLEALTDPSLPRGGPGRRARAVLSQFRASTGATRRNTLQGRYVKLSLPGIESYLHVNEVQVFAPPPSEAELLAGLSRDPTPENLLWADHNVFDIVKILKTRRAARSLDQRTELRAYRDAISVNIALDAKASQSSVYSNCVPEKAVDGKIWSGYTHTDREMSPWLLVDLGDTRKIDRIVVWNREDGNGYDRMGDLNVELLDADRKTVWKRVLADSSAPGAELVDSDARELEFSSALASFPEPDRRIVASESLKSSVYGWGVSARFGESHAVEFSLARGVDARSAGLDIKLKQAYSHYYPMNYFSNGREPLHWSRADRISTLGRFRLLATGDQPGRDPEPVGTIVKLFDTAGAEKADASVPLVSPHPLFEDSGRFDPVGPADRAKVKLVSDDRHCGARAVRIEPGGEYRMNLGRMISIREKPAKGQFRYIRFAFRKYGSGQVSLSFGHLASHRRPSRYQAGLDTPTDPSAQSVWRLDLPPEWIVMDRDIFGEFGRMDLTSLTISCTGGGHAVLDHIYLAAEYGDFKRAPAAPSPEETNLKARRVLAAPILKKGFPAVVLVTVGGQQAGGVIVGDEGYVMTAGHLLVGAGKDATILLRSGKTVEGQVAGVYRSCDVGLVKITDKGPWKGLELSEAGNLPRGDLYVGFTFDRSFKNGKVSTSYITDVIDAGYWTYRGRYAPKDAIVGGPLLDAQGRIVGLHNQMIPRVGMQYSRIGSPRHEWRRLVKGDVGSEWLVGSGPMLGFYSAIRNGGCGVASVYPKTPAAAAGMKPGDLITHVNNLRISNFEGLVSALKDKDPGQYVTITYMRGRQTIRKKMRLARRKSYQR